MSTELTAVVAAYVGFVALLAVLASLPPLAGLASAARTGAPVALVAAGVLTLVDLATLVAGHRPDELLAHLGYAVAALGIGPVLLRPARREDGTPEPVSLPMLALSMVVTAVVVVRLGQTYR